MSSLPFRPYLLCQRPDAPGSSATQAALRRQTDATGRQIDQLVYERYGLTDEKTKIVEEPPEPMEEK